MPARPRDGPRLSLVQLPACRVRIEKLGRKPADDIQATDSDNATRGPVMMRRSGTPEEPHLRRGIFGTEVGDRDPDSRQREQEIDAALPAELGSLPRAQAAKLV